MVFYYYGIIANMPARYAILCTFDHLVIIVFYLPYAILVDNFHQHLENVSHVK